MARVVRFHRTGGPEVLQIETIDVPAPGAGEVRIAVKALGLNRAESMFRSGQYLEAPVFPSRLGYEASGIVESVGSGVQAWKPGDMVSTIPAFSQGRYGVYGDVAVVPAAAVAKHPASLTWTEAAAIWMQYLTPYGALIQIAQLTPADFVLIPAASSSVGLAAMQIANLIGATPIALTRKRDKRDILHATRCGPRHRDRRGGSRRRGDDDHQGCRRARRLRSGRRPHRRQTDGGFGAWRHSLPVRCAQHGTDPAAPEGRLGKAFDDPGLRPFRGDVRPGPSRARKKIRGRRARVRSPQAGDCEDVPIERDRRGTPIPGIERANWEDRGDRLTGQRRRATRIRPSWLIIARCGSLFRSRTEAVLSVPTAAADALRERPRPE